MENILAENERMKGMKVDPRLISICEENGWTVLTDDNDDSDIELEQHSPAGEDIIVCVEKENFVENVRYYEDCFSPDEHVTELVPMRGTHGIPSSIRVLIDDADEIKMMLSELAMALEEKQSEIDNEEGSIDEFLQDE